MAVRSSTQKWRLRLLFAICDIIFAIRKFSFGNGFFSLKSSEMEVNDSSNPTDPTPHSALKFNPVHTDSPRRTLAMFVRLTSLRVCNLYAFKTARTANVSNC